LGSKKAYFMKKVKLVLLIKLIGFLILLLYAFLHESGHALVGLILGGTIEKFVIFSLNPYVRISGIAWTNASEALNNVAGVLLPLIVLLIALAFYRSRVENKYYHFFYALTCIGFCSSLIAWIMIPFVALFASPPAADDATKFIYTTGFPPMLVALAAFLILSGLIYIVVKRNVFRNAFILFVKEIKPTHKVTLGDFSFRWLMIIILCGAFVTSGFHFLFNEKSFEIAQTVEVTYSNQKFSVPFGIKKTKTYQMSLELKSKGFITDIHITNSEGKLVYQNLAEWITMTGPLRLEKGEYNLQFTFITEKEDLYSHFEHYGYTDINVESMYGAYSVDASEATAPQIFISASIK
jgi:hypothetical protein